MESERDESKIIKNKWAVFEHQVELGNIFPFQVSLRLHIVSILVSKYKSNGSLWQVSEELKH